jgi:hypothetical protein
MVWKQDEDVDTRVKVDLIAADVVLILKTFILSVKEGTEFDINIEGLRSGVKFTPNFGFQFFLELGIKGIIDIDTDEGGIAGTFGPVCFFAEIGQLIIRHMDSPYIANDYLIATGDGQIWNDRHRWLGFRTFWELQTLRFSAFLSQNVTWQQVLGGECDPIGRERQGRRVWERTVLANLFMASTQHVLSSRVQNSATPATPAWGTFAWGVQPRCSALILQRVQEQWSMGRL